MKKIYVTFLSLFLLLSCKDNEKEKNAILTESNGKINNVSIIIDESLWNGEVGDSIRKKFAAPVDGLRNEEPIFNLNQYPTKIFEGFVRNSRNIIVIEKSEKTSGYSSKRDAFAKPQEVFYIVGKTNEEIITILEKKYTDIIHSIKNEEILENQKRLRKSLIDDKKIIDRFGISINIGYGYKYDMVEDKFLWIRKEFSSGYNSLLIYEMPINVIENDSNTVVNNIVKMRDSIGKQYIHGTLENTWMVTEEAYSPYFLKMKVAGRDTYETKGTWELKNDFMAGPFINYAIKDEKNNRFLVLEGFTYNPTKSKRDLVFELEAIIKSVKFLK